MSNHLDALEKKRKAQSDAEDANPLAKYDELLETLSYSWQRKKPSREKVWRALKIRVLAKLRLTFLLKESKHKKKFLDL